MLHSFTFIFPISSTSELIYDLSECVGKYLKDDGSEHPEFTKTVMDDFPDEPAYRKCRSALNSSAKLESLVRSCAVIQMSKTRTCFSFVCHCFFRQAPRNGSRPMVGFSTSFIHGRNTWRLVQSSDIVHMKSWLFMVYFLIILNRITSLTTEPRSNVIKIPSSCFWWIYLCPGPI